MTEAKLGKAKLHHILRILLAEYQITHSGESPEKASLSIMETTAPTLREWLKGRAFPDPEKMFVLAKEADSSLLWEWLETLKRKYQ